MPFRDLVAEVDRTSPVQLARQGVVRAVVCGAFVLVEATDDIRSGLVLAVHLMKKKSTPRTE